MNDAGTDKLTIQWNNHHVRVFQDVLVVFEASVNKPSRPDCKRQCPPDLGTGTLVGKVLETFCCSSSTRSSGNNKKQEQVAGKTNNKVSAAIMPFPSVESTFKFSFLTQRQTIMQVDKNRPHRFPTKSYIVK